MYRGSAADFLVVLCKSGNPTTNATERGLHTFRQLYPLRKVLQQGFGRYSAQNRGLGGDAQERRTPAAVCTAV